MVRYNNAVPMSRFSAVYRATNYNEIDSATLFGTEPVNLGNSFYAKIKNRGTGKYITNIENGAAANSLIGKEKDEGLDQIWKFDLVGEKLYRITSVKDNWVLDVHNGDTETGTPVEVFQTYQGSSNQQFYIFQKYDGYYIMAKHSGKLVDMAQDTSQIAIWDAGDYQHLPQEFDFEFLDSLPPTLFGTESINLGTGFYAKIKNRGTGKYITNIENGAAANSLIGKEKDEGLDQIWKFDLVGEKLYRITSVKDNWVLDVHNGDTETGTPVEVFQTYQGSSNQQFYIFQKYDGYYIMAKHSGKLFDMAQDTLQIAIWDSNDYQHLPQEFEIIKLTDHTWKWIVDKSATCTANGIKHQYCSVCGKTQNVNTVINATGHKYGTWQALNAEMHKRVCANDSSHIETANHSWNAGVVTTAATCTANGVKTYTCSVCNGTTTETISATGHSYGAWMKLNDTQHLRVCTNDNNHKETADHTWNDGEVTVPAKALEDGEMTYTCTVCNATKTEAIPKTGPEALAATNVARTPTFFNYNGQQQQPTVTVTNAAGEVLTEGTDYRVTYPESIEPGSYLVRVDGINGYKGTVRKAYIVKAVEALDTANITRTPVSFYENGKQQQPTVTVKNAAGKVLTEGTDYEVTYPVSIESGSYLLRVDGINGYKGTVRKAYTVKTVEALDTANITRTPVSFYENGKQQQPTVTVKNAAGKVLTEGTDYEVTYPISIEPGSYLLRVDGINGYKGTVRKAYTVKTVEALDTANITRTPVTFYYNGQQQQPEVTVKNAAGKVLTEGTDYEVTYPVSIEPGSYMVKIDGINGYKGTVRKAYTIKAVEALDTANITRTPISFTANGTKQQPTVTVKNAAGKVLTEGTDYTVTYPTSVEPGTYLVRIDGINGYSGTVRKAYTIK